MGSVIVIGVNLKNIRMYNNDAKKELLDKYFETNTNFDVPGLLNILTDDLKADYPSNHNIVGKEEYKRHVEKTFSVKSDFDLINESSERLNYYRIIKFTHLMNQFSKIIEPRLNGHLTIRSVAVVFAYQHTVQTTMNFQNRTGIKS